MGAAYFYHVTRRPIEGVVAQLAGRALQAGWRVAVRGTSQGRLDWLDEALWTQDPAGFLPHGCAGGPHDGEQPVLLTMGEAGNGAACLMSIDGADVTPGETQALSRVCVIFDGHDPEALERARAQWRELTGAGCAAQYWSEEEGTWEMKSERPAAG